MVWMLGTEAAMTYERCLVGPGKHAASYRRWVLRRGRGKQATAGSCLGRVGQVVRAVMLGGKKK